VRVRSIEHVFQVATSTRALSGLEAFPDDLSTLTDEQVEAGFADLERLSEAVEAKRLRWLAELDRRGSYRRNGYLTAAAWLSDRHGGCCCREDSAHGGHCAW
jgi:hypothetical protein